MPRGRAAVSRVLPARVGQHILRPGRPMSGDTVRAAPRDALTGSMCAKASCRVCERKNCARAAVGQIASLRGWLGWLLPRRPPAR